MTAEYAARANEPAGVPSWANSGQDVSQSEIEPDGNLWETGIFDDDDEVVDFGMHTRPDCLLDQSLSCKLKARRCMKLFMTVHICSS